jgi:hypothetical protein
MHQNKTIKVCHSPDKREMMFYHSMVQLRKIKNLNILNFVPKMGLDMSSFGHSAQKRMLLMHIGFFSELTKNTTLFFQAIIPVPFCFKMFHKYVFVSQAIC